MLAFARGVARVNVDSECKVCRVLSYTTINIYMKFHDNWWSSYIMRYVTKANSHARYYIS